MEGYLTVKKQAQAEFTEKRSRFLSEVKPVASQEEAEHFVRTVRERNREARHNVFAFRLLQPNTQRYSDDGEPQGTAGIPVLQVLEKSGITNAAVVVTRYFGGILLGAGGLVRAYSRAASLALEAAGCAHMLPGFSAAVRCPYARHAGIASLIEHSRGVADDTVYTDTVEMDFHIREEDFSAFQAALADLTCGECSAEIKRKEFFNFS